MEILATSVSNSGKIIKAKTKLKTRRSKLCHHSSKESKTISIKRYAKRQCEQNYILLIFATRCRKNSRQKPISSKKPLQQKMGVPVRPSLIGKPGPPPCPKRPNKRGPESLRGKLLYVCSLTQYQNWLWESFSYKLWTVFVPASYLCIYLFFGSFGKYREGPNQVCQIEKMDFRALY